jgi:aminoglycoside phosphotransferase
MKYQDFTLPTPAEVEASTDVIFDFPLGGRRVVGLDNNIVVKYGRNIDLDEAKSTSFVAQNTSLPVPRILGTYTYESKNYIFMTRMKGIPLSECLHSLSIKDYDIIAEEMKIYLTELRALRIEDFEKRSYIGSVGFGEVKDKMLRAGKRERGPFATELDLHSNICERWVESMNFGNPKPNYYVNIVRRMYAEKSDHKIVFTHADLAPSNVLVNEGHIMGIVDWQDAGWYPEYWEYVTIMYGCAGTWDSRWPLQIEKVLQPHDYMRLIDLPIRSQLS